MPAIIDTHAAVALRECKNRPMHSGTNNETSEMAEACETRSWMSRFGAQIAGDAMAELEERALMARFGL